jgi:hypothetical protein
MTAAKDGQLAEERQRLQAWLDAWTLECGLADEAEETAAAGSVEASLPPDAEAGECLETGDVGLVQPVAGLDQPVQPVYWVLLADPVSGMPQGVPFGRLPVPALPEEWATGWGAQPLRVLCFWNAQPVWQQQPPSWRVMRLDAAAQALVLEAWRGGAAAAAYGPPLQHPADPRHIYRMQEVARVRACFRGAVAQRGSTGIYTPLDVSPPLDLQEAAERDAYYSSDVRRFVSGDGQCHVRLIRRPQAVVEVRLTDPQGRPFLAYEDGALVTDAGARSGPIRYAAAFGDAGLLEGPLWLEDRQGQRVALRPAAAE